MITSTPVGSWTWEARALAEEAGSLHRIARTAQAIYAVLAQRGCVVGAPEALIEVRRQGAAKEVVFLRERIPVAVDAPDGGQELVQALGDAGQVVEESVSLVILWLSCPGVWRDGDREILAERLFGIDVAAWSKGPDVVTLHTYSDAWLTHSLRGFPQPQVHAANAPRLAEALQAVSELTGDVADPGDPTWFATPAVAGFEELPDEEPELLDSWEMYEVPFRLKKLRSALPSSLDGYADWTDTPVRYVPVAEGNRVLGYLWVADSEGAAGYEPRSAAGEIAYDAGVIWLQRLCDAKARGITPTQALQEFLLLDGPDAGGELLGTAGEITELEELRELAGRF